MRTIPIVLAGLACSALQVQELAAVLLIEEGMPTSTIVIADIPTDAAREGAADLQMWFQKSSGAAVPIRTESEVPPDTEGTLILVGDSERTRALGIDSAELQIEEFVIKRHSRDSPNSGRPVTTGFNNWGDRGRSTHRFW